MAFSHLQLEVKTSKGSSGQKITVQIKNKRQYVNLLIDGTPVSGNIESLKLRVDRHDHNRIVEFRLVMISDTDLPATKHGQATSVQLDVPKTSLTVLADSMFTEKNRHGNTRVESNAEAKLRDSNHSGKGKKSGKKQRGAIKPMPAPTGIAPDSWLLPWFRKVTSGSSTNWSLRLSTCMIPLYPRLLWSKFGIYRHPNGDYISW